METKITNVPIAEFLFGEVGGGGSAKYVVHKTSSFRF